MTDTFQWERCDPAGNSCADIGGATAAVYVPVLADVGSTLRARGYRNLVLVGASAQTPVVMSSPGPATDYDTATAGIALPAFTPTTAVRTCHTQADIDAEIHALASMPSIEYRQIVCAPGITYNGEVYWNIASLPGSFADPHVFWDWGAAGPGTTKIIGGAAAGFYGPNFNNLLMRGSDLTCAARSPIDIAGGGGFQWVDFFAHDGGGSGLMLTPGVSPIGAYVMKGVLQHNGLNLAVDPHGEKGTGIHGCLAADATHAFGDPAIQSVLALKVLTQPTGNGIELGQPSGSNPIRNLDIYLYGDTIGIPLVGTTWGGYAIHEVAGNLLLLWGNAPPTNVNVRYAEGHNLKGRMVDTNGASVSMAGVTVDYARGFNCCLAPNLASTEPTISPTEKYDPRHGVVYVDVG